MATKKQIGIFDVERLIARLLSNGYLDLPCRVFNQPRWREEWLVRLKVPVPEGEPERILYASKGDVNIVGGDPDSEQGAEGTLRAPIAVEATRRALNRNEHIVLAGLPGEPYTGGHWIGVPHEFLARADLDR